MGKVEKKQKGEFDVTVLKLQESITALELEKDGLEQYGCRVCIRISDVPLKSGETVDNVYVKVGEFFREYVQIYLSFIDRAYRIGSEYKSCWKKKKKKEMSQHQLFSWALGIEQCFTEIGNVLKMSVYS